MKMGLPKIVPPGSKGRSPRHQASFSLVLGGPLYQLYLKTRLAHPPLHLLARRLIMLPGVCWLPLLLLAAVEGHLTGGVPVPFFRDPEVHIRFLAALPLLIGAEVFVHDRMQHIVPQFLSRGIIDKEQADRFEKIVASATRLRNSVIVEVVLLLLVLILGGWIWRHNFTLTSSTWYRLNNGGFRLTLAGWYYALVSLSIFRFILIRWYFRIFVWYRFLWQVRALPLHLNLFHPDRSAGLGFLSGSALALAPVFTAQTTVIAGTIYAHILYAGARLPDYKMEIAGALVFAILLVTLPLGFFSLMLEHAGRTAKREFGGLASQYVEDFHDRWIGAGTSTGTRRPADQGPEEPLLGTADIQSLADLGNSFALVSQDRTLPISKETLIRLAVIISIPFLPLLLTMFPIDKVIQKLFKLAF